MLRVQLLRPNAYTPAMLSMAEPSSCIAPLVLGYGGAAVLGYWGEVFARLGEAVHCWLLSLLMLQSG